MTSTETTTRSILDVTVSSRRSSAVKIITDFRETIAAGRIADAIKWTWRRPGSTCCCSSGSPPG
jgi:hypothetical protein